MIKVMNDTKTSHPAAALEFRARPGAVVEKIDVVDTAAQAQINRMKVKIWRNGETMKQL